MPDTKNKILAIIEAIENFDIEEGFNAISTLLFKLAARDKASGVYHSEEKLKQAELDADSRGQAHYQFVLGRIHLLTGDLPKALKYLGQLELDLSKSDDLILQQSLLPKTCRMLSIYYYNRGEFEKSFYYVKKAIQSISEMPVDKQEKGLYIMLHGDFLNLCVLTQNYTESDTTFTQSKTYFEAHKDSMLLSEKNHYYQLHAIYLYERDRFEESFEYFQQSEALLNAQEKVDERIRAALDFFWGGYYKKTKEYDKAIAYFLKAEGPILKYEMNEAKVLFQEVSFVYKEIKDFEKALCYHEKYHEAHLKLLNEKSLANMVATEYQYILEKEQYEKEYSQKLAKEKEAFFMNIAHDIRSALTLINPPLEEIRSVEGITPKLQNSARIALFSSSNLLSLSNQLMDINRIEAGKMPLNNSEADWVKIAKQAWEAHQELALSKGILYRFASNISTLLGQFDKEKLYRSLANLLSNAIKFTPEGESIELRLLYEPSKSILQIEVKDSGRGISEKEQAEVFKRFHQSTGTKNIGGVGLGLTIVHQLSKLMGFELSLDSQLGQGSNFSLSGNILVNYYRAKSIKEENSLGFNKKNPLPITQESNTKILIIEDNPDIKSYISGLLEENGWSVMQAEDGKIALNLIEDTLPNLIISDINMPNLDGLEFCRQLKSNIQTSHIPIILLSALPESSHKQRGLKNGADAYLSKPIDKNLLFTQIQRLLNYRKDLKEHYKKELTVTTGFQLSENEKKSVDDEFIENLIQVIDSNMHEDSFGVEQLSELLFIHKKTLYRKINSLLSLSINELIRKRRLNKAMILLENKQGNITDISIGLGFSNISYFAKCFKDEFGILPSKVK